MARVKICSVCKSVNEAREPFCKVKDCGTSLADVTALDDVQREPLPADYAGTILGPPANGVRAAIEFSWGSAEIAIVWV